MSALIEFQGSGKASKKRVILIKYMLDDSLACPCVDVMYSPDMRYSGASMSQVHFVSTV